MSTEVLKEKYKTFFLLLRRCRDLEQGSVTRLRIQPWVHGQGYPKPPSIFSSGVGGVLVPSPSMNMLSRLTG